MGSVNTMMSIMQIDMNGETSISDMQTAHLAHTVLYQLRHL